MAIPKLSAAIITFNEEKNICRCLESVRWMDELIVVDSFSTDHTVELARQYTDKVVQRQWPGHVLQKQFALEQATGDWIISLDADEELSPEAAAEIKSVLAAAPADVNGYSFPRQSFYLGRWIKHGGWYPDRKVRLVRRGHARWGGEDPHDKLVADGQTRDLRETSVIMSTATSATSCGRLTAFPALPRELWFAKGRRAGGRHDLQDYGKFFDTYVWKLGMLDGMPGLIISVISSYYVFLKYAKLWELQKGRFSGDTQQQ